MTWGGIAAGAGSVIGGVLGSKGSGGGGGGTPKWLKPYQQDLIADSSKIGPQQYYPGQNFIGGLPSEQAAFDQLNQYNQGMYGQGGLFGGATGAAGNAFSGNTYGGQMTGALSPFGTQQIMGAFGQGPGQVGQQNFDPRGMGPQFGQAGGLDASSAWRSMLSGTPDYSGAQGAIDAANAPLLRQFNQEIIPGLNQRATFLNNGTGGIKTLNKVLPELGQRMDQNALGVMEGERQRALQSQQYAAGAVSQGGLQSYGMGQQGAMFGAQLGLDTDLANAGFQDRFRGDTLQLGGLGANLSGNQDANAARWGSMFPGLANAGRQPSIDAMGYAQYMRMLAEGKMGADMDRWNFNQQAPQDNLSWRADILGGIGGQAQSGAPSGGSTANILGGAMLGGQLGGALGDIFGPQITPPTISPEMLNQMRNAPIQWS